MNKELYHYGVLGMKWGVRRYQPYPKGHKGGTYLGAGQDQNKDELLTELDRERKLLDENVNRNKPYTDDINNIVDSLSERDKKLLGAKPNEPWIDKRYEKETLENKLNSFVLKHGSTPISFVEIWTDGGETGQIAVATRSGKQYRGKGYANQTVKQAMDWVDKYGKYYINDLIWVAAKENEASINLAKNNGFIKSDTNLDTDDYVSYYRPVRR